MSSYENMTDDEKIKEILFYGRVLSDDLLCKRFEISEEELHRLLNIYYSA